MSSRLLIGLVAGGLLLSPVDAFAARKHHKKAHGTSQAAAEAQPKRPYVLVVSLSHQHVSVYNSFGLVERSRISTGKKGHSTPTGVFTILGKERFHRSNLYSNAPMPFMQRITWSGVALHAGVVPGYPASHGCIRMPSEFARKLFGMTSGRERVIVTRQDITPVEIAHHRLPVPQMHTVPADPPPANPSLANETPGASGSAGASGGGAGQTDGVIKIAATEATQPVALNPIAYAERMQRRVVSQTVAAQSQVKAAKAAVVEQHDELRKLARDLSRREGELEEARDGLAAMDRKLQKPRFEGLAHEAEAARTLSELAIAEATTAAATAAKAKEAQREKAAEADRALAAAEAQVKTLATERAAWSRRQHPVSVFISRKTGKIYVRQKMSPLFEAPVTIKNPEIPLGTHVYTALDTMDNAPYLKWWVFSAPNDSHAKGEEDRPRRRKGRDKATEEVREVPPVSTAAEALERIEISEDVRARIAELTWEGATVIVSDLPLSAETNEYTDFILTRL